MLLKILVFWLCLCFYSSNAEELNTGNLVKPADEWTLKDRASTTQCSYSGILEDGEVCTGHANQRGEIAGGGSITSDEISLINQGLSVGEIQQGFDYQYGATIESHRSNTTVLSCENTNFDCKDYFTITVNLSDHTGTIFKTHEHTVEMNYVGQKTYSYSQTLAENQYQDILFQIDIWSVDAGYTSGYYGGIISQPNLSVAYQTVEIITDVLEDIVIDIIYEEIDIDDVQFEVVIDDLYQEELTFEFDLAPIEDMQIELPEIEEITVEIEAEVEEQITEEIENEVETTEPQDEGIEESENTEPTNDDVEEQETTIQIKQKIANKLMANQKDKMSIESQTTQIALMVVLADNGFNTYTDKQLLDNEFYKDVNLYLNQNMIEDKNVGIFYMDYLDMNKLVDQQWQN